MHQELIAGTGDNAERNFSWLATNLRSSGAGAFQRGGNCDGESKEGSVMTTAEPTASAQPAAQCRPLNSAQSYEAHEAEAPGKSTNRRHDEAGDYSKQSTGSIRRAEIWRAQLYLLPSVVGSNCQDLWILGGPKPGADVTSGA